jgi:hypothetical protein
MGRLRGIAAAATIPQLSPTRGNSDRLGPLFRRVAKFEDRDSADAVSMRFMPLGPGSLAPRSRPRARIDLCLRQYISGALRANRGDHVALIASGVAVQVHERLGVWQAGSIPDFHFRKVLQNASSDEALGPSRAATSGTGQKATFGRS